MDPVILDDLRKAYESGQLIAFVGAGVSFAGGLPSWKGLAQRLLGSARGRATAEEVAEMEELIAGYRLLEAVSAAKDVLRKDFEREVIKALDDGPIDNEPEAAKALAALAPRLWAVITTNLDRFLERAFGGRWDALTDPPGNLGQQKHYILKIHGTLRDARTWVFTRAQYDRAMYASPMLQKTIGELYGTHPLLFVGFGLEDDNIDLTLGQVRALSGEQPPTHYALFPKGQVRPSRRRSLEDAGIRLIEYPAPNNDHSMLVDVLRWLAAPAGTPIPGSAGAPPAAYAVAPAPAPQAPAPQPPAPELPLVRPTASAAVAPAPAPADGPLDTFICYAPGDADLVKRLETHLTMVRREKLIAPWSLGEIGAGEEIGTEARERLEQARLILLLVSVDFLASDEHDAQVAFAMEQHRRRAARVIPILLRKCDWEETGRFKDLQVLPRNKVPVNQWKDADEAFTQIAKELREVVKKLRAGG